MRFTKHFLFAAVATAAFGVFADAGNTLVTFSTTGDSYVDGSPVQDGEWYALCWSQNAEFGGFTSECEPAVDGDRVFLMAPLAEGGKCPTVVFQIRSSVAPTNGNYFVYLLDTRGVDGVPSKSVDGKPVLVKAAVATTATAKGNVGSAASANVTGSTLVEGEGGSAAWGESSVDDDKIGNPVVKAFRIDGDKAVIKVTNMHASVLYNIFTGSEPGDISKTTLSVPVSSEKNDVEIFLDKDQGQFFKIGRQPLKK